MKEPQVIKPIGPRGRPVQDKTRIVKLKISRAALEKAHARAIALGEARAMRSGSIADRHCPGFVWKAQQVALRFLKVVGQASSEEITDVVKSCGLVPHDDRAFGAVYMGLARSEQIRVVGQCHRRKGHGTSGGRVWALV